MSEYVIECDYYVDEGLLPGEVREEIVRCRDCMHYLHGWCVEPDGDGGNKSWKVEPDGFCSDGEQKEVG